MQEIALIVAREFLADVVEVTSLGEGRINDTYLVTNGERYLVLRRINPIIFPLPKVVVENFSALSEHFSSHQEDRYIWSQALLTIEGRLWHEDADGGVWHAQRYLILTDLVESLAIKSTVNACGACLARFHQIAATDTALSLQEPLAGFHHLPSYFNQYDQVQHLSCSAEESLLNQYIRENREKILLFSQMNENGALGRTIIHGDPKADNFVFGESSIGLIDLDTAYYGSVHIDLGDALRSFCNPAGEDGSEPDFDLDIFSDFISGYMGVLGDTLSNLQKESIYDAVFALTYELGLRFFTDHLSGDNYFKVIDRGDNLNRSIVQFELCQKIEEKKKPIMDVLKRYSSQKQG